MLSTQVMARRISPIVQDYISKRFCPGVQKKGRAPELERRTLLRPEVELGEATPARRFTPLPARNSPSARRTGTSLPVEPPGWFRPPVVGPPGYRRPRPAPTP